MRNTGFLWSVVVLGCAVQSSAWAQSMAVVGADKCETITVGNVKGLREALSRKIATVQSEKTTVDALGSIPTTTLADVERVLSNAQVDYGLLAFERVADALSVALQDLNTIPPSEKRCQLFREASMLRAWNLD